MIQISTITSARLRHSGLAVSTQAAGGLGILDLECCEIADLPLIAANLRALLEEPDKMVGLKLRVQQIPVFAALLGSLAKRAHRLIFSDWTAAKFDAAVAKLPKSSTRELFLEIIAGEQVAALQGFSSKMSGLLIKGNESGGWVGGSPAFILAQQVMAASDLPVHVQGGIGPHTAAACFAAGAAGVVLDDQLLLMPESPLPEEWKTLMSHLNGSETVLIGEFIHESVRVLQRPGFTAAEELRVLSEELEVAGRAADWKKQAQARIGWSDPKVQAWPVGQSIGLAAQFLEKYRTVGRLVQAIQKCVETSLRDAAKSQPLAENSPLAVSHGTRFPIMQGPMTRVSDVAAFANMVSEGGALPMLALALLRGSAVKKLMQECHYLHGERPWGIGLLGFVPLELQEEQIKVILEIKPKFALIAGGRPEQAEELEKQGIISYLHVPTPQLLEIFIAKGTRRFIFEGRECGGHVGPLTSFTLWESVVNILLKVPAKMAPEFHLIFAGGIHDARSGAMISALAAPLAARGMKIGVLMGTAYLFTSEAVSSGAIVAQYQKEALDCTQTINLETSPGHASRCVMTPFATEFYQTRRTMLQRGEEKRAISQTLEDLTLGRLRVASKGLQREGDKLIKVGAETQRRDGMYMIGQAAMLRDQICTIEDLHQGVTVGAQASIADRLASLAPKAVRQQKPSDIAIVGMSAILPGAQDIDTYWDNILNKVNSLQEVPVERWDWQIYFDPIRGAGDKVYAKCGGFLEEINFDPMFFGIPPTSVKNVEPMQLLALETVRRALADAGYENGDFDRENTSVVFGVSGGSGDLGQLYAARCEIPRMVGKVDQAVWDRLPEWTSDTFPGLLLNVVSGRVANRFDFGGANYTLDAACASSLAAIDAAVRELEDGRCNVALAGGVDTMQSAYSYMCFSKSHALSPRGEVHSFDMAADGIVISEGVGVLVLKRLADAKRDGDQIYAVIKGVGSSSDGKGASLTVPTNNGQLRAMRRAYAKAGCSPATVSLYEAHGTGTAVGDPVELDSFAYLLKENDAQAKSCVVGSVKTLIGHTKGAAGVASMIKTSLALHRKVLPPHAGVKDPLHSLRDASSPLFLNTEPMPWIKSADHPRRAGVSAFGFGGTNFHAVLEEYVSPQQPVPAGSNDWPCELFVWKTNTREQLLGDLQSFQSKLDQSAEQSLLVLAKAQAAQVKAGGPAVLAIVAADKKELHASLVAAITDLQAGKTVSSSSKVDFCIHPDVEKTGAGKIAFLFPGQGSQYPAAVAEAAVYLKDLSNALAEADEKLKGRLPRKISQYVLPPGTFSAEEKTDAGVALSQTQVAQPAIGAISCGFLDVLQGLRIEPDFVAGHSYGEFTALHAAGVMDRQEFLQVSATRGSTMQMACEKAPGSMAAVADDRAAVAERLKGTNVGVANHNSPKQTIITGATDEVARVMETLKAAGVTTKLLPVAGAFHSPLMQDAQTPLVEAISALKLQSPLKPVFANAHGQPYSTDVAEISKMLCNHMLSPVEFVSQIEAMYEAGARYFIEVGPRSVLTSLTAEILKGKTDILAVSVDGGKGSLRGFLQCLARMHTAGLTVDFGSLFVHRCARPAVLLPKAPPAQQWLLNGGGIRRASEAATMAGKAPALLHEEYEKSLVPVLANPIVHSTPNYIMSTPNDMSNEATSLPPAGQRGTPISSNAALHAYTEYQETMRHFLKVQEEVMRQFLSGDAPVTISARPLKSASSGSVIDVGSTVESRANGAKNGNTNGKTASAPASAPTPTPAPVAAAAAAAPVAAKPAPEPAPAPKPAAAPVAETPAAAPAGAVSRSEITGILVNLVSDRTGYPVDMLGMDQDLEADLGIDSIKRVEIVGAFQSQLPPQLVAKLTDGAAEDFTRIRTLQGWVDALLS